METKGAIVWHHALKHRQCGQRSSSAWSALASRYNNASKLHLRQLFADDPQRGQRMAIEAVGLYLDYSKNRVTDETLNIASMRARKPDSSAS